MGPPQTRSRGPRSRTSDHAGATIAERLDLLRHQIERSIVETTGGTPDELFGEIVFAAVAAFRSSRDDLPRAAATIAHLLERFGEQIARQGSSAKDLAATFQAARTMTQKYLGIAIGDLITIEELIRLREDVVAYLFELHVLTHASFVRTERLKALTSEQRRGRLGAMTFGLDLPGDISKLAAWEGIDPDEHVVAIVSIAAALPLTLREHPSAIAGTSVLELLAPATWATDDLAAQLAGQAVVSPSAALAQASDAVSLARRGAELLRLGKIADARTIVPGADLLGHLVVENNQLLADLIIDKHLSAFEQLTAARRITLGELALASIESGQPIDQVAKALSIPRQTAHSRMRAVREILGDALHDPDQRLELIVALRAALPRWRHRLRDRSHA